MKFISKSVSLNAPETRRMSQPKCESKRTMSITNTSDNHVYKAISIISVLAIGFGLLAGCASPTIVKVEHSYTPQRDESVSLMDNPCVEQAIEKAKKELDLKAPQIVDSYVTLNMDAQKRGMIVSCSVDVQISEEN